MSGATVVMAPAVGASPDQAVAQVLRALRRGRDDADPRADAGRRRFTIAQGRAVVQWREQARPAAAWVVDLLRAGHVLAAGAASVTVHVQPLVDDPHGGVRVRVEVPRADAPWPADAGELMAHVLEADRGARASDDHATRERLVAQLVGRAVQLALGEQPPRVELRTPRFARVWAQRVDAGDDPTARGDEGRDPYDDTASAVDDADAGAFELRVWGSPAGVLGRLGRWFSGGVTRLEAALARVAEASGIPRSGWASDAAAGGTLVLATAGQVGPSAGPAASREPARIGDDGRVWLEAAGAAVVLWRDGVRIATLDRALAAVGIAARDVAAVVDAPDVRRTADDADVVRDAAFERLTAWLLDAHHHAVQDPRRGPVVAWPEQVVTLRSVSGRPVPLEQLEALVQRREHLFVWPTQRDRVPEALRARVLELWPSEQRWLREHAPQLRFTPASALGASPELQPTDLTALQQGALGVIRLSDGPQYGVADPGPLGPLVVAGQHVRSDVDVYVHRFPRANAGQVMVLAWGRRVAVRRDPAEVIEGVSIVARLEIAEGGPDIDALRGDAAGLREVCRQAVERVRAFEPALLHAALDRANPWELPYVQSRAAELDAIALELAYGSLQTSPAPETDADAGALTLRWNSNHPLLGLPVAQTHDDTLLTLGDALTRVADVGGLVVGSRASRWPTLETGEAGYRPCFVHTEAQPLLQRLLGDALLWTMPIVPQLLPRPRAVAAQPHLRLDAARATAALERAHDDPKARAQLVAHVCIEARERGGAEPADALGLGLLDRPLLRRYDPRALVPVRLVSLRAALQERPALAPMQAVSRGLPGPVLEVEPGVAALLAGAFGLGPAPPAPRVSPGAESSVRVPAGGASDGDAGAPAGASLARAARGPVAEPQRRRGSDPVLVRHPFVDDGLIGRIDVESGERGPPKVGVWSRGLHVDDVELPAMLAGVHGRVWLWAGAGARPGGSGPIRARVEAAVRDAVTTAVQWRALLPVGSAARTALHDRVAGWRAAVQAGDDPLGLRDALLLPRERVSLADALESQPLRRLPVATHLWLEDAVRQACALELAALASAEQRRPDALLLPSRGERVTLVFEAAWLRYAPARLHIARGRDGRTRVGVTWGLRHPWVQEARSPAPLRPSLRVFELAALTAFAVVVAAHEHAAATRHPAATSAGATRLADAGLAAAGLADAGPGSALTRALVRLVALAYAAPVGRSDPA